MTPKGKFNIEGSFTITGRGIVVFGSILDGTLSNNDYFILNDNLNEIKLKIKSVEFMDNISDKTSKIGLIFYYKNEGEQLQMQSLKLKNQIGIIVHK